MRGGRQLLAARQIGSGSTSASKPASSTRVAYGMRAPRRPRNACIDDSKGADARGGPSSPWRSMLKSWIWVASCSTLRRLHFTMSALLSTGRLHPPKALEVGDRPQRLRPCSHGGPAAQGENQARAGHRTRRPTRDRQGACSVGGGGGGGQLCSRPSICGRVALYSNSVRTSRN